MGFSLLPCWTGHCGLLGSRGTQSQEAHSPWSLLFRPDSRKETRPAFFLGGPSFSGPAWRTGPREVTPRGCPFGQPAAWHCHQEHGRRTLGPPTTLCQIPMSQKSPDPRGFGGEQTKSAEESPPPSLSAPVRSEWEDLWQVRPAAQGCRCPEVLAEIWGRVGSVRVRGQEDWPGKDPLRGGVTPAVAPGPSTRSQRYMGGDEAKKMTLGTEAHGHGGGQHSHRHRQG